MNEEKKHKATSTPCERKEHSYCKYRYCQCLCHPPLNANNINSDWELNRKLLNEIGIYSVVPESFTVDEKKFKDFIRKVEQEAYEKFSFLGHYGGAEIYAKYPNQLPTRQLPLQFDDFIPALEARAEVIKKVREKIEKLRKIQDWEKYGKERKMPNPYFMQEYNRGLDDILSYLSTLEKEQ